MNMTRIRRKLWAIWIKTIIKISDIRFHIKAMGGGTFYSPLSEVRTRRKLIASAKRNNTFVVMAGRRY